MARKHISLVDLDFDGIKNSLKNFLQSQSEFQDYDFEGSSLNILLDVLAANSHYYAMYSNMMANEMFLDSAQLRSSVASHAKMLGYTPRSIQSAKAIVDLTVSGVVGTPSSILVPRGYKFLGEYEDAELDFVTVEDVYLTPTGNPGEYSIPSIEIFEGKTQTYSYTVTENLGQRFIIPTKNIDTRYIRVSVQLSATNLYKEVYTPASKILDLKTDSKVFFIQETSNGEWELLFGDGVLGKQPTSGNIVLIEYLSPTEGFGNGVDSFTVASPIFSGATHTITTVAQAGGAIGRESTESIRLNAKRNYASQERSVTPFDYETNIRIDFPNVLDVKAWGGEDNDPPIYGKVFVSVLNSNLTRLTSAQKNTIADLIKKRNVINIRPEIVDPELESIRLVGHVRYNEKTLDILPSDLRTNVVNAIADYGSENLQGFDKMFSYSEMLKYITTADSNIKSVDFKFYPGLYIRPTTTTAAFDVDFRNEISPGSVWSAAFLIASPGAGKQYHLGDDGNGNLRIYSVVGGDLTTKAETPGNFGTVNYSTGLLNIENFAATLLNSAISLKIECQTVSNEMIPFFNQVLFIDSENLKVEVIPS